MKKTLVRLKEGHLLLALQIFLFTPVSAFLPTYFNSLGSPLFYLIALFTLSTLWAVVFLLMVKKFEIKTYISVGYLCYMFIILGFIFLPPMVSLFVCSFLYGAAAVFFWTPLNTLFYRSSSRETNAVDSAIYFLTGGLLAVILPPLGAYIITRFGYFWLFFPIAMLYLPIVIFVYSRIPKDIVLAPLSSSVKEFKNLKTITALEGALHFLQFLIIPVYTLQFMTAEKSFGWFASYMGLIGFVIAIILSYRSDRTQKRISYLAFLFVLMGISALMLILAARVSLWIVLVGIFSIFYHISNPLRLAITMDVKKVDLGFWKAREIFLNLGRFIFMGITLIFFYFKLYWAVFGLYAVLCFVYPVFVKKKLKELIR